MDYIDILVKVGLIILLSGIIGLDRELKHKPAGAKTHILVGLGSTIFMLVSIYVYMQYKGTTQVDPGRIAAQVVTGIGFLGAGTIIQSGGSVTGLTTAASLWSVAGIGLAVGCGMYYLAIIATVAILFIFVLTNKISEMIEKQLEKMKKK
ncbi:MAG: MgtC/SapB family protein [Candidatus Goldbacteria bacterium]|nr:MgtC/SapB family protein [Candidatus Goldiibacteriota bacterium]